MWRPTAWRSSVPVPTLMAATSLQRTRSRIPWYGVCPGCPPLPGLKEAMELKCDTEEDIGPLDDFSRMLEREHTCLVAIGQDTTLHHLSLENDMARVWGDV